MSHDPPVHLWYCILEEGMGRDAPSLKFNKLKFYDRPSGASKMQENLSVAKAPPSTPLGSLQLPTFSSWWRWVGFPSPRTFNQISLSIIVSFVLNVHFQSLAYDL